MNTFRFYSRHYLTKVATATLIVMLLLTVVPALADTAGPRFAGAGAEVGGPGTIVWNNEGAITADDANYATSVLTPGATSEYLQATQFGFTIPPSATINGIQVTIMRQSSSNAGGNSVDDSDLFLLKAGAIVGNDHASGNDWPTSMGTASYGGPADLWNTTWTPAEVNATGFGVALSVLNESAGIFGSNRTASVDYIQITVTYTLPATTTTVTSSLNPSNQGDSVTFTATVTSATPGTITGTVTFYDNGTPMGPAVALSGGAAQFTISTLTGGSHNITAQYSGDTNYSSSNNNPAPLVQGVNSPPSFVSANNATFTVLNAGQTFVVQTNAFPNATLTIPPGSLPANLTFTDNGNGTATISGTPATGTAAASPYTFVITANNGISPNATQTFTLAIAKRNQTINFNAQATAQYGQTFNVTPTATSGLPVTITSSGGCTNVGFAVTMTSATTNCVLTASQAGDADYNAAPNVVDTVTAQQAGTIVTVDPSPHTSTNPSQSFYSYPMLFTITVTSPGGTPTGTVTLTGGTPAQNITSLPLDASGVTYITTSNLIALVNGGAAVPHGGTVIACLFLPGGCPALVFTYNGDANFASDSETVAHAILPAPTQVTVTSDINPSAEGELVTFTITVSTTAPGTGIPPGTVTIWDGSTQIGGPITLVNGEATFSTSTLTFGSHNISARYINSSDNYATSNNTTTPYVQVVNRATTTTLTSDNNPSIYGENVTFTATITSATPGAITGTVTFYDGAAVIGTDNSIVGGVATFTTNSLVVGSHPITAVYSGNATYSTSTSAVLDQVVNKATLTVTADDKTITYGDADPTFTFQYSGFVLGQTAAVIDTPPTCSAPTPHVDAGSYPGIIECTGAADDNYDFVYVNGDLIVSPKALTITADNQGKTYGDVFTFNGTEFTVTGLIFSDTVTSVTLTSAGTPAAAIAGTYPIIPSAAIGTGLGNYTITYVNGTMTVGANVITISADNQTKTYGDVFTFNGTEFTVTGLQPGDSVTSVTLTSAGAPSAANVGTYPIVPSAAVGVGLGNYVIVYSNGQMDVNQRTLTFNPDNKTKVYGDVFSGYTGSFTGLRLGDNITAVYDSLGAPATATVGVYDITVSLNDPDGKLGNYIVTIDPAPTATLTVTQKTLTITANNQSKPYGTDFIFAGTEFTTNGLTNGDTVDSATLTSTGAPATAPASPPTYPIVPSAAVGSGLSNYAINYVNGTMTVTKPDLIVTSDSQTKIYGDVFPPASFTGSIVGIQNGDNITATYASAGEAANANVGSYPINITLVDPGNKLSNYNVTYNIGQLTVVRRDLTVVAEDKTKVYGDTVLLTGIVTGVRPGDNITFTYSSSGTPPTAPVGTYTIAITLNDPLNRIGNYNYSATPGTLTVTLRDLVVTSDDKTKQYGTWFFAFTGSITGIQNGDNISASYASTGSLPSAAVGPHPITISLNDPTGKLGNYNVILNEGTLTVGSSALTVTADNKTIIYGDPEPAFTLTYAGFASGDTPAVLTTQPTCTVSGPHTDVGTYPIVCSGGVDDAYTFTYVNGTLTVNPRTLVVTPTDKSKNYGDVFSAFTGTITGVQPGDIFTVDYASTGAVATAPVGDYPITATVNDPGNRLSNYTVTMNTGTLTVIPRALTVTPADKTKIYGDVFSAFTGTITGIQNGDNITANYASTGAPAPATVGTYPITVTLNDPGNVLSNYTVTLNTGTLTVTQRTLVVTPDNHSKVFGTVFSAFTGTITGIQNGDNITATYASTGAPAPAPVGTYPITATLNDPGNKLPNYTVTLNTGTLTVTLNVLTVTANDQTKVYGDPDPAFTFTYAGFQGTDTPAVLTTQPTCQVLPAHNAIGTYPITCSGGLDDNYSFNYVAGTLTVTPRPLTVTPNDQTKVYGSVFTAFTGTVTGLQASDNITVVYSSTGSPATAPVGAYPITVTLNDPNNRLGNYTVTLNTGTLTVTPRALVVTPDDKTKVYGAVFTAFTGNLVGIQNGDNITATYASTGAPATAPVGAYPITVTLNDPGNSLGNYTVTLNTGTLTVTQRDLVVTPADKTKVYGDVFTAFTGTITGIQNGDAITATYASPGAVATATVAGSPYPITATLNAPAGVLANYNVILNTGELTVTLRPLTVTPDNKAKVFGTTFTAFTGTITGIQAGDNITATYASPGAPAAAAVGTYPITATLNDPGNRLANYTVTLNQGTLTVGLTVLTVTANDQTKIYGAADPVFTFAYSGFQGTDTPADLTTQPTCQVTVPHIDVGTYAITCSGGVDDNYIFNYVPATLTITPRALTVTPDNKTKVYGDVFTTFTGVIAGIQGGDNITATYASTGAPATAAVGTYPITVTLNDPGGRLANYTVTLNTGTLTVTQRALMVTPTDQSKIYGNVFTAFTGTIVGIQNGDPITATYASPGAAAAATVGTYPITATLNAPAGVLANYAITSNTGTLTVTQRDLTVTPADKTKTYGTLFTAFTGSIVGLQNGDAITATYSSPGAPANAAVGDHPINVALNDPNGRLANYNVTLNTGTLTVNLANTTTAVTSDNNPAGVTDPINFTATVTSPSGTPTGTVTFFDNGNSMGTFPLTAGVATLTTSTLPAGSHTITATYNGDANFNTSTSAPYIQGVGQTVTTTVVTSNNNPSYLGQSVTFTANVTSNLGVPTGTVTFLDGAITMGTGTLSGGYATFTTTTLLSGTHNITASYGGDPDYFGSVSAIVVQVVIPDTMIDTAPPNPDNDLTPIFTFSSTIPTATFACRIDGAAFAPCSSGDAFGPLSTGTHTFDVRSIDSFGNVDPTPASYTWVIDTSTPDTNIDTTPPALTNSLTGTFTFSSPSTDLAGFECRLDGGAFAACTTPDTLTGLSGGSHTFEVRAVDNAGNRDPSPASYTWTVDLGYPTVLFNTNTVPANNAKLNSGPTKLKVAFSKDVKNDSSAGAANNPANFLLVEDGVNGTFETTTCALGLVADDVSIPVAIPTYTNRNGTGPFIATFVVNGGTRLPIGTYRLFVCGTTSIEDIAGNELNDGASDTTITFTVQSQTGGGGGGGGNNNGGGLLIPVTGFKQGAVTQLPAQPADKTYSATDVWIEIPKLGVSMPIVGVPKTETGWDISWLGNNAGWLNGSAFPTWSGNSVITAHVWTAANRPGPFAGLLNLQYGDKIKVHAYGQVYTYEIVESSLILPSDIDTAFKHAEKPYLTLITCEGYQDKADYYTHRRMLRAMLVSTEKEK